MWDQASKEMSEKFIREQRQFEEVERSQPTSSDGAKMEKKPVVTFQEPCQINEPKLKSPLKSPQGSVNTQCLKEPPPSIQQNEP